MDIFSSSPKSKSGWLWGVLEGTMLGWLPTSSSETRPKAYTATPTRVLPNTCLSDFGSPHFYSDLSTCSLLGCPTVPPTSTTLNMSLLP